MFEGFILGTIQGITEWLPISSEGFLVLVQTNFFNNNLGLANQISVALFLHFGTFLAALVYFWEDVVKLTRGIFNWKNTDFNTKLIIKFLIVSSLVTGLIAGGMFSIIREAGENLELNPKMINIFIGILLLFTGIVHMRVKKLGIRKTQNLNIKDSIWSGVAQGVSVLPGLSRSGLTIATLLLRRFDDTLALRLSFLMSLPVVLTGNIILNTSSSVFKVEYLWGLFFSFIFGLLTIHLLLKLANKFNFGKFVLFFAILVLISVFI